MRSLDRMNRGDCPEWSPLPRPEVPHCARRSLWFGSIRRTEWHYSFIRRIRNLHSRNLSEFDAIIIQNVQPNATLHVAENPSFKLQTPVNHQIPISKTKRVTPVWDLNIGTSLEFG